MMKKLYRDLWDKILKCCRVNYRSDEIKLRGLCFQYFYYRPFLFLTFFNVNINFDLVLDSSDIFSIIFLALFISKYLYLIHCRNYSIKVEFHSK